MNTLSLVPPGSVSQTTSNAEIGSTEGVEQRKNCQRENIQLLISRPKQQEEEAQFWNAFKCPRSPVDEHLRKVSEAIYAFVSVYSDSNKSQSTGFSIADDGFILTICDEYHDPPETRTPQGRRKVQLFDGTRVMCSHIQDFQTSGVSVSLLKGDIENGFLKPDDLFISNESMAIVSFGDEDLVHPTPVVARGRVIDTGGSKDASAVLEMDTPREVNAAIKMTGGPVLSMRPGYFSGVISCVEPNGVIRFCPVTATSAVWLEFERAMNKYRETHGGCRARSENNRLMTERFVARCFDLIWCNAEIVFLWPTARRLRGDMIALFLIKHKCL